jgi:DNA-binding LacI/PurR family transcriptional regulator
MQGKLTIQDLARQARVSKITTSQIFNQSTSAPLILHERVMCVIQEYRFLQLLYPLP